MKKNIHPKYNHNCKITCSTCKTTYVVGSILDSFTTELCANCHPQYTGEAKVVDTANRIDAFEKRQSQKSSFKSKKEKMAERKKKLSALREKQNSAGGLTLKDMLTGAVK